MYRHRMCVQVMLTVFWLAAGCQGDGGWGTAPAGSGAPPSLPAAGAGDSVSAPGAGTPAPAEPAAPARPLPGIWISRDEVRRLPMRGPAWEQLLAQADRPAGQPNIRDQNDDTDVEVLARALVFARTGVARYRDEVVASCLAAIDTELGGRTLALGRNLVGYVIAADLVGLDPADDQRFRAWLRRTLSERLDGKTLRSTHEERPNNWGTHAGASRAAVAVYLGDDAELARVAQVFRGWLGDRAAYAGFRYGDLSWQADEEHPVGINPRGARKRGELIDGVLPDDLRRGCGFRFPPCRTGYVWEGLQGATVQAELLRRRGYDAWSWSDQALRRAVQFLYELDARYPDDGWWASGDDTWNVWLVNHAYEASFPTELPARHGKNMGWTDWTHAGGGTTTGISNDP